MQFATLGERLRDLRIKKELLQSKVAEFCEVKSGAVVSAWEKDISKPDVDTLLQLCELYEVSPNYLLGYSKSENESILLSPYENKVINYVRLLDDRGCAELMGFLQAQEKYIKEATNNVVFHGKSSAIPECRELDEVQLGHFLNCKDLKYYPMKQKCRELRKLKNKAYKTEEDVTKFLWDIGYGTDICILIVSDIFAGRRIPDETMYKQIYAFLTSQVRYSFDEVEFE